MFSASWIDGSAKRLNETIVSWSALGQSIQAQERVRGRCPGAAMESSRYNREPALSRQGLVLGLYGSLAVVALLISAGREDVDIYRIEGVSTSLWLGLSPALGVAAGVLVVILSRIAVRRFDWARALHHNFRELLGPLTSREILIMALASSIGEELLFRGALQPWLGLVPQAVLFGLLHIGPGRRFLAWTVWALGMGLAFGGLVTLTGDLGGAIVAHFTINFMNLHYIARVSFPTPAATGPHSHQL